MREIEFHKTWWLKWYWDHIDPIYRVEGHYGTRQSGKTHNIGRKLIYHSFQYKKFNVVHVRKVYKDIEGSTFKILTDIIKKDFLDDFTITKDHMFIQNKHTGNWFRGLGMEAPENAKSIEGANVAWLNEANQFTIDDYDYIDTTIRGATDCDISMILDWNPESQKHWLYKEVQELSKSNENLFIKSTFWDNYIIDRDALHQKLLRIRDRDPDGQRKYKVWGLGEWGIENTDKKFARDFDEIINVVSLNDYNVELDIYLCFDLNYDPYCLVIQFNEKGIYVLKEYHTIGYSLPAIMGEVMADFPINWPQIYIINGDVSGNHSRNISDNTTSYEIIKDALAVSWDNFHIPSVNPSHVSSRQLCNMVFKHGNIRIHESCTELITDLELIEVDERGSLDPYKSKHPERSGWLDALRYHINSEHSDFPKKLGIANILNK